jgi:hypothetical protein
MTLAELKGLVDFRYMRESAKLDKDTLKFDSGEFVLYYNTIMQEIFSELNISETTQDIAITPVTVYTTYALSSTYGQLRNFELVYTGEEAGISRLTLTPMEEMPTVGDNLVSGTPNRLAIFSSNDGLSYVYLYPLSGFTGTLRLRYKINSDISAGVGAGGDLTASVPLPVQYKNLLISGILSMLLPEFVQEYRFKLSNAPYLDSTPSKGSIDYSLGGF